MKKTYGYIYGARAQGAARLAALALALVLAALLLAGCNGKGKGGPDTSPSENGGKNPAATALSGPTVDILQQVLDDATANLDENAIPATFTDPLNSETAPATLGITPDDYASFVDEATSATAAINTFAFEVAVARCKSDKDAATVAELIQNGYDSGKWVCVIPERSMTIVSGSYVLLAVGKEAQTNELAAAFKKAAGGVVSSENTFYEGETGGAAGGDIEIGDEGGLVAN